MDMDTLFWLLVVWACLCLGLAFGMWIEQRIQRRTLAYVRLRRVAGGRS